MVLTALLFEHASKVIRDSGFYYEMDPKFRVFN